MTALLVAVAGGLGALARFIADERIHRRLSRRWPIGTLTINCLGSLLLGGLLGLLWYHHAASCLVRILGTGFCGGFTTFSAASFESVRLFRSGRIGAAALFAVGGLVVALGAGLLGIWLASL